MSGLTRTPSSVVDEVAIGAFWTGLVLDGTEAFRDVTARIDFDEVKENFLAASGAMKGSGNPAGVPGGDHRRAGPSAERKTCRRTRERRRRSGKPEVGDWTTCT